MHEPIAVEARFAQDGAITPLSFTWRGTKYPLASLGRHWEQEGRRHFLVMDASGEVFEIAYHLEGQYWQLHDTPTRRTRSGRPA